MIKALVFDVDNTLYDYDAAHLRAFQAVTEYAWRAFGLSPESFAALHRMGDKILRERVKSITAAIHNRLLRYQVMLEQIERPISHAPQMAELYWSVFLSAMVPGPGLAECLSYLKTHRYVIGVGTNMTADYQYAKLARLKVLEQVDFMVSSEEVGAEKPNRQLFDCCVEKAGCAASECAFVGDSLENDALGAKAAGLLPVWLHSGSAREGGFRNLHRIGSLSELPALLESL